MVEPSIVLRRVDAALRGFYVFRDLDLELRGKGLYLVLGPNGAGKTTLLKLVAGLIKPVRGRVEVCGENVAGRPDKASKFVVYVPQLHPMRLPPVPMTVEEYLEAVSGARRSAIEEALRRVGLGPEYLSKTFQGLSGGELQRVFLAYTELVNKPVVLLDEPLSSVDVAGKVEIAEMIKSMARDRMVVVTSHDPTLFLDRDAVIVLLNRGLVAVGRASEVLREEVLEKVYGKSVTRFGEHVHLPDQHLWKP